MHVPPNLYDAVARGEAPRELAEEIEREHFAALCPVCTDSIEKHEAHQRRPGAPSQAEPHDPLERLRRRLKMSELKFYPRAEEARAWIREVSGMEPENRRARVCRANSRFRGQIFYLLMLEEARRHIPARPLQALSFADAVLGKCEKTADYLPDPEVYAPALAIRGNAYRALGRLQGAEKDLQEAHRLLDAPGVTDPETPAEVFSYLGSLRKDQGRLQEAAHHLDRAAALYRLLYEPEKTARVLLALSLVHYRGHDTAAAVVVAEEALGLLDDESEAWLRAYARYNLAHHLHAAGETERAEAELAAHAELLAAAGDEVVQHVVWLRARIAWSREQLGRAERLFKEARRRAQARGIAWDAGLVSLELALVHLVQGRTPRVKKLAQEALKVFAEQKVDREVGAALELLEAAARREAFTRELFERAIAALDQARFARPAAGR